MIYTKNTVKALNYCLNAYGKEKHNNIPLIFYAYNQASKLDCEDSVCVALLNIGLEFKKFKLDDLKKEFPFTVIDALFILIKDDILSYPDYIRRIKGNKISTKVKIVELENKKEMLSLQNNKQLVKQQMEKYNFALKILK